MWILLEEEEEHKKRLEKPSACPGVARFRELNLVISIDRSNKNPSLLSGRETRAGKKEQRKNKRKNKRKMTSAFTTASKLGGGEVGQFSLLLGSLLLIVELLLLFFQLSLLIAELLSLFFQLVGSLLL